MTYKSTCDTGQSLHWHPIGSLHIIILKLGFLFISNIQALNFESISKSNPNIWYGFAGYYVVFMSTLDWGFVLC